MVQYLQNLGTDPNVSSDMEISTAFAKSLKVWFILRLFLACFGLGLGFASKDLGISANLSFYHLSPLILKVHVERINLIHCKAWMLPVRRAEQLSVSSISNMPWR